MTRRPISIDLQGAKWAYSLGHFGYVNPFDPDTPHAFYWWQGKGGLKFEYRSGGNCA